MSMLPAELTKQKERKLMKQSVGDWAHATALFSVLISHSSSFLLHDREHATFHRYNTDTILITALHSTLKEGECVRARERKGV